MVYARVMAETLAVLYWVAHIDGSDVEFVLAPERQGETGRVVESGVLGEHTVWLLDFDCCRDMSQDEAGVEQAVAAFYKNDPFFSRPGRENERDRLLWKTFRERFLEASGQILGSETSLARLWVKMIEAKG